MQAVPASGAYPRAMTSHPNEAVLARFYEQFPGGDLAPLITEDAFALIGGSNALSGHHQGRRDTVASLAAYRAAAPDGIELDIHDILANDDHGLAIVRVTARQGDAIYDEWETHVFELDNGAIAGIFVYWNDPTPADAFFT